MKVLVVTGPPYSGKGTQCEILEKHLGFKHISTGKRIRLEKEKNTRIGQIMKDYEEKGMLVPDEIMEDLLIEIIKENEEGKGIILDGYPRTVSQVDTLIRILQTTGKQLDLGLNIEVPKSELLVRAKNRAKNSDRKDDQDENVHIRRIEVFEKNTQPAIIYLKEKARIVDIDGIGKVPIITERIISCLSLF